MSDFTMENECVKSQLSPKRSHCQYLIDLTNPLNLNKENSINWNFSKNKMNLNFPVLMRHYSWFCVGGASMIWELSLQHLCFCLSLICVLLIDKKTLLNIMWRRISYSAGYTKEIQEPTFFSPQVVTQDFRPDASQK